MSLVRDLQLARKAKKAGAKNSLRIVREARRTKLPVSWAFALVDQESGFCNIFGHDAGSILKGQPVTRSRVRQLLAHVGAGGNSNGVGFTQLTWPPYIRLADQLGGAHVVKNQLRVGFEVLADCGDLEANAWRYNGARRYQSEIKEKQRKWHRILSS